MSEHWHFAREIGEDVYVWLFLGVTARSCLMLSAHVPRFFLVLQSINVSKKLQSLDVSRVRTKTTPTKKVAKMLFLKA